MNKKNGTFLIILGSLGVIIAMNMDTTVGFGDNRIFNIGLISKQRNTLTISILILVCGILMKLFGGNKKKIETSLFSGSRDISDRNYQLFLVRKYSIEKNQTMDKYSMDDQVYETLNLALEKADAIYNSELVRHDQRTTFSSLFKKLNVFNFGNQSKKQIIIKMLFGLICAVITGMLTISVLYPDVYRISYIFQNDEEFDLLFYFVLVFIFVLSITTGDIYIVMRRVFVVLAIIAISVILLKVSI
jgi:hypothetical protein